MQKRSFIIDTDMAVDDWFAIIMMLKSDKIDVKAICVNGVGEAYNEVAKRNALKLIKICDKKDTLVSGGRSTP